MKSWWCTLASFFLDQQLYLHCSNLGETINLSESTFHLHFKLSAVRGKPLNLWAERWDWTMSYSVVLSSYLSDYIHEWVKGGRWSINPLPKWWFWFILRTNACSPSRSGWRCSIVEINSLTSNTDHPDIFSAFCSECLHLLDYPKHGKDWFFSLHQS